MSEKCVMLVKSYTLKVWVDEEEVADFLEKPVEDLSDDDLIAAAQEEVTDWLYRDGDEKFSVKVCEGYTDFGEVE